MEQGRFLVQVQYLLRDLPFQEHQVQGASGDENHSFEGQHLHEGVEFSRQGHFRSTKQMPKGQKWYHHEGRQVRRCR